MAGIIKPIAHQDVKCCGATTLAKKAHEGNGLMLNTLRHRVNDECVAAGFPSAFGDLLPIEETDLDLNLPIAQNKWHVCEDFAELNKVTKVPPMPQGDIKLRQQNLSGHRWITVFDFANGFYACEIKLEDQPYVCFYMEGPKNAFWTHRSTIHVWRNDGSGPWRSQGPCSNCLLMMVAWQETSLKPC